MVLGRSWGGIVMRAAVLFLALSLAACQQRPTRLDNAEVNAIGALREVAALKDRVGELESQNADLEDRIAYLEAEINQ